MEYRICNNCIMDTSDKEISFDHNGKCNHCRNLELRLNNEIISDEEPRKNKLIQLINKIKKDGEGKEFDCLCGISGGIDSMYVLYMIKKFGLRPLAIHLDNGWNSELAVNNIEKVLKKLDVPLFTYVIDWEEFRDLQLAFIKSSIANIEIPTDHAIGAIMFQMASKNNIRHIITGSNLSSEGIMPSSWMYDPTDLKFIKHINKIFGLRKLNSFPKNSLLNYFYYLFIKKIKWITILNYLNYDKNKAKNLLIEGFGWKDYSGKHYESIFTRFFQAYYLPKKFNIDKRRAHFSSLICSKQMTRDESLELISQPICDQKLLKQDYDFFIKKFNLSATEFEELMDRPNQTHRNYPSHHYLFENNDLFMKLVKKIVKI